MIGRLSSCYNPCFSKQDNQIMYVDKEVYKWDKKVPPLPSLLKNDPFALRYISQFPQFSKPNYRSFIGLNTVGLVSRKILITNLHKYHKINKNWVRQSYAKFEILDVISEKSSINQQIWGLKIRDYTKNLVQTDHA